MKQQMTVVAPATKRVVGRGKFAVAAAAGIGLFFAVGVVHAACYAPGNKSTIRIGADARLGGEAARSLADVGEKSAVVAQTDSLDGEKYSALIGEDGSIVGWMEADGTTYDATGALFARIDAKGNVVGADGSILFDVAPDCGPATAVDGSKLSWAWGLPPHIRFNRTETRRIDAYGSLAVAPICSAAAGAAGIAATPAVGVAVGVACLAQTGAIIGVARYAVRHNKCAQISVPASIPSTWGC
jgi:hypothetical protein